MPNGAKANIFSADALTDHQRGDRLAPRGERIEHATDYRRLARLPGAGIIPWPDRPEEICDAARHR
ncbi:MAG TPA: hypothetical protein VJM34_14415 [Novosphingobium sp.]|nr:hypothetical protein [Novosphingobium sp.]